MTGRPGRAPAAHVLPAGILLACASLLAVALRADLGDLLRSLPGLLPHARVVVRDLETGLRFVADRYGGYRHADAQPATVEDTRIMKAIYGGEWSWLRRAVVVEVGGRRIAASMNGMPGTQREAARPPPSPVSLEFSLREGFG